MAGSDHRGGTGARLGGGGGGRGGAQHRALGIQRVQVSGVECVDTKQLTRDKQADCQSRHDHQLWRSQRQQRHVLLHRLGGRIQVMNICLPILMYLYLLFCVLKRFTQDAPEVVVHMLLGRRAEMNEVRELPLILGRNGIVMLNILGGGHGRGGEEDAGRDQGAVHADLCCQEGGRRSGFLEFFGWRRKCWSKPRLILIQS